MTRQRSERERASESESGQATTAMAMAMAMGVVRACKRTKIRNKTRRALFKCATLIFKTTPKAIERSISFGCRLSSPGTAIHTYTPFLDNLQPQTRN